MKCNKKFNGHIKKKDHSAPNVMSFFFFFFSGISDSRTDMGIRSSYCLNYIVSLTASSLPVVAKTRDYTRRAADRFFVNLF